MNLRETIRLSKNHAAALTRYTIDSAFNVNRKQTGNQFSLMYAVKTKS